MQQPSKRLRSGHSLQNLQSLDLSELAASLDLDTPAEQSLLLEIDSWPESPINYINESIQSRPHTAPPVSTSPVQNLFLTHFISQPQSKEAHTQTDIQQIQPQISKSNIEKFTQTENLHIENFTQTEIKIYTDAETQTIPFSERNPSISSRKSEQTQLIPRSSSFSKPSASSRTSSKPSSKNPRRQSLSTPRRRHSPTPVVPVKLWSSIKRLWGSIVPGEESQPQENNSTPSHNSTSEQSNGTNSSIRSNIRQHPINQRVPHPHTPLPHHTTRTEDPLISTKTHSTPMRPISYDPSQRHVTPIIEYQQTPRTPRQAIISARSVPKSIELNLTLNLKPKLEQDVTDKFEYDIDDADVPTASLPSDAEVTGLYHTFSSPTLTASPVTPLSPLPPSVSMSAGTKRRVSLSPVQNSRRSRSQPRSIGGEIDRRVAQLREIRHQLREHRSGNNPSSKVVALPRNKTLSALDGLKQRKREALIERQKKLASSLRIPRVGSVPRNVKLPNPNSPSSSTQRRPWRSLRGPLQRKTQTDNGGTRNNSRQMNTQSRLPHFSARSPFRTSPTRVNDTNAHM